MNASTRRQFLADPDRCWRSGTTAGGTAFAAMVPNDKFDLVVKGGEVLDPSSEPAPRVATSASAGAVIEPWSPTSPRSARCACSTLTASWLRRPRRHSCARLSLRLRDRHSGRRAHELPGHHDHGVGGRWPAPTTSPLPPLSSVGETRTRLYPSWHIANFGARLVSGAGTLQHRLRRGRRLRQGGVRKRPTSRSGSRCGMSEKHHRQQTAPSRSSGRSRRRAARAAALVSLCHIRRRRKPSSLMSRSSTCCSPGDILTHAYSGLPNIAGHIHQYRAEWPAPARGDRGQAGGVIFDVGHGGGSFRLTPWPKRR